MIRSGPYKEVTLLSSRTTETGYILYKDLRKLNSPYRRVRLSYGLTLCYILKYSFNKLCKFIP